MAGPNKKFRGAGSQELAAAISAILAVTGGTATAQDQAAPGPADSGGAVLSEVVVTATRRSEKLQDVAESISAIDTDAIAIRGLSQMEDYAKFVPGLTVSDREPGGNSVVFRGVTGSGVQFGAVSSSGLYLDEQPITQAGRNPDPRLIDIERVEALRGPQGTLYGASSQSGTLRIITNKPDPKAFDAWAEAQLSTVKSGATGYDVSAMVNIPLASDRLALRLVGFTAEDAGFIDNVLSPSLGTTDLDPTFDNSDVVKKDINSKRTSGGRAALRWNASDDVNLTLGAVFQDVKANGHGDVDTASAFAVGDLEQVRFEKESLDDKWYQLALTLDARLPIGNLVVAASYFDRDFRYESDATAYENAFNQIAIDNDTSYYNFGGDPRGFAANRELTHISTIETRLSSNGDSGSRWAWLVGAFYSQQRQRTAFDSHVRDYVDTPAFAFYSDYEVSLTGNPLAPTDTWFLGTYESSLDEVAAFGELSYNVTEHFRITAGGRYFDYDRKNHQHQEQPQGFTGASLLENTTKVSEDGFVSKLNLSYRFDGDRMLYATYSEGFRVGGSNPLKPASILPRDYASDELKNYELGLKSEWLDHHLRINIAAYYMKWDNFAVQVEDPGQTFQLGYVNLPSADFKGVEAEFAATLGNWQLDGSIDYNQAETAKAAQLTLDDNGTPVSFPDTPVPKGTRLPLTPEWTGALGLEYRPDLVFAGAKPYGRIDYAYQGSSLNSLAGIESVVSGHPAQLQESYEVVNLRFGLDAERWSGSIYADNLFDERADLFLNNRWNYQRESINAPRTVGVQVHFKF
jgi:outer membrane receptor protein involved in Fe transport